MLIELINSNIYTLKNNCYFILDKVTIYTGLDNISTIFIEGYTHQVSEHSGKEIVQYTSFPRATFETLLVSEYNNENREVVNTLKEALYIEKK